MLQKYKIFLKPPSLSANICLRFAFKCFNCIFDFAHPNNMCHDPSERLTMTDDR